MFRNSRSQSKEIHLPVIWKSDELEYEEFNLYDSYRNKSYFAIRNIPFDQGVTSKSIKLFEKLKYKFSQFTQAKINASNFINPLIRNSEENEDKNYLVMLDDQGNQLHLTGCTCGYTGTGSHGTLEILNKAGFCVDKRFVFYAQAFSLPYPNVDNEL
ncbi:hypothetical protein EXW59_01310 (plasmid) [Bacillus mycoides]|uniref:hypothetical protein n=1 Tax=Bacillus mycoides TaxID=1405 RepID=UPI001C01A4FE|nr:hypothetical protein [Bacillus mycoides]QWH75527.1 hypothetical protein EXW59_01310 [Bacillus mycoides]